MTYTMMVERQLQTVPYSTQGWVVRWFTVQPCRRYNSNVMNLEEAKQLYREKFLAGQSPILQETWTLSKGYTLCRR